MLSNAYFVAKFRFDTAEKEPTKNLQNSRIKLKKLLILPGRGQGRRRLPRPGGGEPVGGGQEGGHAGHVDHHVQGESQVRACLGRGFGLMSGLGFGPDSGSWLVKGRLRASGIGVVTTEQRAVHGRAA